MKPPVIVDPLFSLLDEKLIRLLRSLDETQWHMPTIARLWRVKDIAAHLLDGNMRTISMQAGYFGDPPGEMSSYDDLLAYLNRLNADWVQAFKRISPQLLTGLLETTGKTFTEIITALPPFEKALFSVAWAGEQESFNWMHVAREYTEKFIHQMQIRHAVGETAPLFEREFFYPFIDTCMYGLVYTLRNVDAPVHTSIKVSVKTGSGGDWFVTKQADGWIRCEIDNAPAATVSLPPDIAWQLFSKGITPLQAKGQVIIEGDERLADAVLGMVAVMA